MNGLRPRAMAQERSCGSVTAEAAFDPLLVNIASCDVRPDSFGPNEPVICEATVTNDNSVDVSADVSWFFSDLPNGPGVGPTNVFVGANSQTIASLSFRVQNVSEIPEPPWSSSVTARILPGSVSEASAMGMAMLNGGVDRGTALVALGGAAAGGSALLALR